MRLLSASLVVVAASVGAATQAATPKEYAACSPQQSTQYFSALSNEVAQCQKSSTFDLVGGALPSTTQRAAVCKCSALLQKLPNIRVPRCKIALDGNLYKFKDAIESVFVECNGVSVLEEPLPASQAGSGADEEGETGGEADVSTPAPTTAAPTNQTTSSAPGDDEPSAGSIDELPTTEPASTEEATATKAPAAVPTPAPTTSGAGSIASATVVTLATTAVAVATLLA